MSLPVVLFVGAYLLASLLLSIYGAHAFLMTWLYHRRRRIETGSPAPTDPPMVTVQLPLFNELYVARRLIDAVCAFDYPRSRLEIQVLDDSTDATLEAVAAIVSERRGAGFQIEHVRRSGRAGFKGGALREGLALAKGDLVAVFDADFLPPPDFLVRTVPAFADPGIGMVQTRWGHLNADYSLLTQVQAMALDGHFLIEQTARNRNGAFINFNGTAGIWRREAILDAGNWQDDTLTEDLDLSYRAQLKGWRFLFLPDVVCPAELPAEINGLKGQQFRWAKGSVQTALKLLPDVLRSGRGAFTLFEGAIHLTNHAVYPLLLFVALASLPALVLHTSVPGSRPFFTWATVFILGSLGHPALYFYSRRQLGKRALDQCRLLPLVIATGMGIAINNSRAICEALFGIRSVFHRTPKYDLRTRTDDWRRKAYRPAPVPLATLEVALGLYLLASTVYSAIHAQYLVTPFLALYAAGTLWIGLLSFRHAAAAPPRSLPLPAR